MSAAPGSVVRGPEGVASVRIATDEEPWLGGDFMDRWDALARACRPTTRRSASC